VKSRKSSFCASRECVEVASEGGNVFVKGSGISPVLVFSAAGWAAFTAALKTGQ